MVMTEMPQAFNKIPRSNEVLVTRTLSVQPHELQATARLLGYPYYAWNDRIFVVEDLDDSRADTGFSFLNGIVRWIGKEDEA